MKDVNHALANLRQLTGIPTLEFDAGGNLTLVFNGETLINLARIDDLTIEIWTELRSLAGASDPATLRRMMEANHLGEGTGRARIALAPETEVFVLCERISVEPLSGDQLADRLVEFLKYTSFWTSAESARVTPSNEINSPDPSSGDFVIRA